MSSNILIVESPNDQYFLQAIIRYLNFNIEVAPAIMISEDDYKSIKIATRKMFGFLAAAKN